MLSNTDSIDLLGRITRVTVACTASPSVFLTSLGPNALAPTALCYLPQQRHHSYHRHLFGGGSSAGLPASQGHNLSLGPASPQGLAQNQWSPKVYVMGLKCVYTARCPGTCWCLFSHVCRPTSRAVIFKVWSLNRYHRRHVGTG